jgi:hypothetical protein
VSPKNIRRRRGKECGFNLGRDCMCFMGRNGTCKYLDGRERLFMQEKLISYLYDKGATLALPTSSFDQVLNSPDPEYDWGLNTVRNAVSLSPPGTVSGEEGGDGGGGVAKAGGGLDK